MRWIIFGKMYVSHLIKHKKTMDHFSVSVPIGLSEIIRFTEIINTVQQQIVLIRFPGNICKKSLQLSVMYISLSRTKSLLNIISL